MQGYTQQFLLRGAAETSGYGAWGRPTGSTTLGLRVLSGWPASQGLESWVRVRLSHSSTITPWNNSLPVFSILHL